MSKILKIFLGCVLMGTVLIGWKITGYDSEGAEGQKLKILRPDLKEFSTKENLQRETAFYPFQKYFREYSILRERIRGGKMTKIVEEQLEKLGRREAVQAYETCTSKDFQKATSFTAFQEYMCWHPVLLGNTLLTIEKRRVGKGIGTIEGIVASSDAQKMRIEYRLVEENGAWKIHGLFLKEFLKKEGQNKKKKGRERAPTCQLMEKGDTDVRYVHAFQEETPFHPFHKNLRIRPILCRTVQSMEEIEEKRKIQGNAATLELVEKVDGQLKAFREHDVLDAYYGFVSKNFQRETPFRAFQEYVRAYPILLNHTGVNFKNYHIEGDRGYVDLALPSEKGDYQLHYQLTREKEGWRIWSLCVLLPPEEAAKKAATDPRTLAPPVKGILEMLASRKASEAYAYTAKEFRDASSFDTFQKFVDRYPVLIKRDLADIQSGSIEDGVGKLCANLHDEEGMSVFEFRLGFEEGEWKIWGMKMIEHPEEKSDLIAAPIEKIDTEKVHVENIFTRIQEQLNALRHQDFFTAYFHLSSENYQKAHSLEQLEAFLKKYPAFTQNLCATFTTPSHNNDRATVRGIITTFDQKKYPVRYELINEEGVWKIHAFAILSEEEAEKFSNEVAATNKEALYPVGIRG